MKCPECGGDVEELSSNLTELGYVAEDKLMQCVECGHTYPRGEPVGEYDEADVEETECNACDDGIGLVYQVKKHDRKDGVYVFRLKCNECYRVWTKQREFDEDGVITVAYGSVLGRKTSERGRE